MSTKAPGEILELFRGGYLSMAETIDALDGHVGYVSVELLNIERAISDDLRAQNAKLREAAATPAVGGEEGADSVMVPKSALAWLFGEAPDPDGKWFGERDPGPLAGKYPRKYWWRSTFRTMISAAPPASPLRGREPQMPTNGMAQIAKLIDGEAWIAIQDGRDALPDSLWHIRRDWALRKAQAIMDLLPDLYALASPPEQPADPLSDLVSGFAKALLAKLRLASANGRSGWERDDWEKQCQQGLLRHLEKGDPRDVAAYCAFMWHHGWITAPPEKSR